MILSTAQRALLLEAVQERIDRLEEIADSPDPGYTPSDRLAASALADDLRDALLVITR